MSKDRLNRPIRPVDFLIVVLDLFHNLIESFLVLVTQLSEIAMYHSTRQSQVSKTWEEFTQDLETIQEDKDGTAGCD